MKKSILTTLCLASLLSASAQDANFSYFKYTGNDSRFNKTIDAKNQYMNPILAGFYPDPAVCRKGDTYYLVNSSFSFFPGVPIFESKDLVNWSQIGHVLDRESQLPLTDQWVSGGIYAPAISYNERNKTFYMITTNVGKGNFYVKSTDPHKGWSEPIYLPKIDGIDPSFLFDNDGKAYIVHNAPVYGEADYNGQRAIRLLEFDVKGDSIVGEPMEIVRGGTHLTEHPIWIEGPHLYHIGKYYYLMCAEGGTGENHSEVIFRSKSPKGPWEECPGNPILTQREGLDPNRSDIVTCAGHADLIETKDGEWWAVFLGSRPYEDNMYNTGRDTYLLPVTWTDGWPQILQNGKAIPTVVDKKSLTPSDNTLTGNFTYTDNFKGKTLNDRWMFLRNAPENAYTLSDAGLTLHAAAGDIRHTKPMSALFCRQQHTNYSVETELSFRPTSAKKLAGMTVFQDENHHLLFGKTIINGQPALVLKRAEKEDALIGSVKLTSNETPVNLKIVAEGRYYSFYYKEAADSEWKPVALGVDGSNLSTAKSGGFIGAVIGLYATKKNAQ
jgi:alpha-N-arabinofuranosidase